MINAVPRARRRRAFFFRSSSVAAAAALLLLGGPDHVLAQTAPGAPSGQTTVVITGSVVERALADAPYAIGAVGRDELRSAGPLVHLSESLVRVPGLVAANRWNYAQDLQISSRGFGARAGFGVRGIRLYSDGIPASGPDGQGQVSHFDLAGAERVEVLRGPFSVLYGNSSGGVISIFSAPVKGTRIEGAVDAGSFGLRQLRAQGEAQLTPTLDLRAGASALKAEGFRPHSEAERRLANLRLGWRPTPQDSLLVTVNHLDQPADDPLGLTRDQFDADPLQTTPQAMQFDTRKTTRQTQLGGRWRHRYDTGWLREAQFAAYAGRRDVVQFLAIPAATQGSAATCATATPPPANCRHGGGVIDFARAFHGAEARMRMALGAVDVVAGLAADRQRDDRQGHENYVGTGAAQQLGVQGALRRDEINRAATDDAFVQAEWSFAPAWSLGAGVRAGRVTLTARDLYPLNAVNGDDSGERRFSYTNPVVGLRFDAAPGLKLHLSAARGFESPTLGELAYRADGLGGFNTALAAQRSEQLELGAKWRADAWQVDVAAFDVRVDDEIGVATNAGGRSAFQNVGRTTRRGVELAARWAPAPAWRAALAATALDARYRDDFLTCAGIPCTAPTVLVPAGNRIAGTQRGTAFAELAWRDAGLGEFAAEMRHARALIANDLNTEAARPYTLAGLRWSHRASAAAWLGGGWSAEWLLRIDNVFDRRYAGSVIVNESNGRHYETGAPRAVGVSLRLVGP
ncbi:MAG: TonB-dependent receptor [Betaproteobacteria bacterium]|nr:TonB-dependent receptor [Betaproteobacteria bacterium]MCC6249779.1 TonB-dependent receptor [Rubrivivax sp.]